MLFFKVQLKTPAASCFLETRWTVESTGSLLHACSDTLVFSVLQASIFFCFFILCVFLRRMYYVYDFFLNSNRVQDHHTEHTHDNSVNCDLSKYRDLTGRPTELKRTRRLDQPTAKCDVLHLHHTNHDHQLTATMQTSFHINVSTTDVMH